MSCNVTNLLSPLFVHATSTQTKSYLPVVCQMIIVLKVSLMFCIAVLVYQVLCVTEADSCCLCERKKQMREEKGRGRGRHHDSKP